MYETGRAVGEATMPMPSDSTADREQIMPDPQLEERQRRRFTAEQKRRILDEVDGCTEEGWLYLAVVIDLYSRQVVGWTMSDRMKATLVCDALTMALYRRGFPRGVVVHSDRGSQYCSRQFQRLIEKHGLLCSMSRRGDCYDNACAESFFHSFKIELNHGTRFSTREALRREVFQYIETYYNVVRRHSALGHMSPAAFETQKVA
jgi:transposase InsO family protein